MRITAAVAGVMLLPLNLSAQTIPATAATASTAPFASNDLESIAAVLRDPSAAQNDRDEAARRLSNLASPEALAALEAVLKDPANVRGQRAVARALTETLNPDPRFIVPLGALLSSVDVTLAQPAAQALTNYNGNGDVRARLLAAATDRSLPRSTRIVVIQVLESMSDKRTARTLLDLFNSEAEPIEIRNAAADALRDMTGQVGNDRDPAKWRQWWEANAAKPDEQFIADVQMARAKQLDRLRIRNQRLIESTQAFLRDMYLATPENRREDALLRMLRDTSAPIRETGAQIVQTEFNEARPISAAVREQLRRLVGDSSGRVRREVAEAIYTLNDSAAADALLAQLSRERDPDVWAEIAKALVRFGDLRAAAPILAMLQSNAPDLVRSAADALRDLGPKLRQSDPALGKAVTLALTDRLEKLPAGSSDLRDTIISAMVPYGDPDLRGLFTRLLLPSEPAKTRILALKGFGEMRRDWAADNIVQSDALTDPDPAIRLAAVEAMGKTALPVHGEMIYGRLNDESSSVQQAAWDVLTRLFAQFDSASLAIWADRFRDQPDRRLVVLQQWQEKVQNDPAELAVVQQNIGDAYLKQEQYAKAAENFQRALDYYSAKGGNLAFTEGLVSQLLEAYLLATDFERATSFAAEWMKQNPGMKPQLGSKLYSEANRLRSAGEIEESLRLVELTEKIGSTLPEVILADVRKLRETLKNDIAKRNGGAGTIDPPAAQRDPHTPPIAAPLQRGPFASAAWTPAPVAVTPTAL